MRVVIDTNVFASAVFFGAEAGYIVSGERDLLAISPYRGVTVVRPRDFLEMLRQD